MSILIVKLPVKKEKKIVKLKHMVIDLLVYFVIYTSTPYVLVSPFQQVILKFVLY